MFLLAGQFPGASPGQALANALTYVLAAERAGFTGRARLPEIARPELRDC